MNNKRSKSPSMSKGKYYSQLSATELDAIAAPFDQELLPSKPLTPAMRRQELRARRKRGRPQIGEGAEKVLITVERGLLRDADAYARKHNKNRSQLFVESLRRMIGPAPQRRAS